MYKEWVVLLETVLDHLTGEELGNALARLNDSPHILDALFLPGIGKKNRPSGLLQALCKPENEEKARDEIFRHTHALGLRRTDVERYALPREHTEVEFEGGQMPAKIHELEGEKYQRIEADALARLAARQKLGMPALRFRLKANRRK